MKIEILIDGLTVELDDEQFVPWSRAYASVRQNALPKQSSDPMVTAWQAAIDHTTGGKCAWSAAYEALGVAYNRLAAEVSDLKQENAAYDGRIVAAWAERDEARRDAVGYQQECAEYSKDVEAARGERNRYGKEAAVLRNQLEESREETNMYSDHAIATGKLLNEAAANYGMTFKPTDHQVGGDHYQHDEIQPIQVIQAWRLRFEAGNVLKYLYRLGKKGDVGKALEDIDKAVHYLQLLRADIELRGI